MKETITLQLGSYANYVGMHYWNFQEELLDAVDDMEGGEDYEHRRLFRSGRDPNDRSSLKPRVLVSDLAQNLGHVIFERKGGAAVPAYNNFPSASGAQSQQHSEENAHSIWDGGLATMVQDDAPTLHPFQFFLRNSANSAIASPSQSAESNANDYVIKKWTDYQMAPMSQKSMATMPLWYNTDNFDTFLSGRQESSLADYIEDYLERFRSMSEECDNLSTVQIFADIHDGFSNLTSMILEEIRQEYRGVSIPVFAFTENGVSFSSDDKSSKIGQLGVPYAYSRICDDSSIMLPISCNSRQKFSPYIQNTTSEWSTYQTSGVVATAIENIVGSSYINTHSSMSDKSSNQFTNEIHEMSFNATNGGRFPLCHLETCFPFPLFPDSSHDSFMKTFEQLNSTEREHETKKSFYGMNPFATSLSAARTGKWRVQPDQEDSRYIPYSNVVAIRGPTNADLQKLLFSKCSDSSYLLTSCIQRQTALYIPKSFPHFFSGVNEFGFANNELFSTIRSTPTPKADSTDKCVSSSSISAIGTDASMGIHVSNVAETWSKTIERGHLQSQLNTSNLDIEECNEITEKLRSLRNRYEQ